MSELLPCEVAELRTLFLFEKLDEAQLDWLCRNGHVEWFEPGYVYREDDLATSFYVLLEGELAISRRAGNEDVEINRTSQVGAYAGAWRSFFGDDVSQALDNTLRDDPALADVCARRGQVRGDHARMVPDAAAPAGRFVPRHEEHPAGDQSTGRLLALGSLSAGFMHELNNPTAAAMRATAALRGRRVLGLRRALAFIMPGDIDRTPLGFVGDHSGTGTRSDCFRHHR